MLKILDRYILKGFLPMLLMTFLICWFIVLMQFLWKYVDELVGKGLGAWVVGQTIFYAAMSLIPLSLPLGILLASLMYFGQIGERLELLAMKASGVPLYRIMAPIFTTVLTLAVGLLVFQNTYMITSQVRMWTLLYSARSAKPELEIPEGAFYNGIPGFSIYVGHRDKEINAGRMHDIMLYDHKGGNEKTRIIRADSGRLLMDEGKTYLTWRLYKGQSFENMGVPTSYSDPKPSSFAKEKFSYKEIVIAFDANINIQDESNMRGRFVGKDLAQLKYAIDTSTLVIDSLREESARQLIDIIDKQTYSYSMPSRFDTTKTVMAERARLLGSDTITTEIRLDSILARSSLYDSLNIARTALSTLQQMANESENRLYVDKDAFFNYRTNRQEWHRKFTFPAACLVFFFIGAPLGAIIRKGGLGVPVIVSVLFFITYYIIDTFGHNMINTEKMGVIPGMWISTWVLLPIGAWLTWQATRDSASLNLETYNIMVRKLLGSGQGRKLAPATGVEVPADSATVERLWALEEDIKSLLSDPWVKGEGFTRNLSFETWLTHEANDRLSYITERLEAEVQQLSAGDDIMLRAKLQDLPKLPKHFASIGHSAFPVKRFMLLVYIVNVLLPISLPILWYLFTRRGIIRDDLMSLQSQVRGLREYIDEKLITNNHEYRL